MSKFRIVEPVLNLMQKHKGKFGGFLGLGGLGVGTYLGVEYLKDKNSQTQQTPVEQLQQANQQTAIKQPQQTQQQATSKQQEGITLNSLLGQLSELPKVLTGALEEINRRREGILNAYAQVMQDLNNEFEAYTNIVNELSNKTSMLTNAVITFLAKQGFGAYLDTDFAEHIAQTIIYTPAHVLTQALEKASKGYFLAKASGVDTSGLSYVQLMEIADNPNYAKMLEPRFLAGVDVISKTLANQYNNYLNQYKLRQEQKKTELAVLGQIADILQNQAINEINKINAITNILKAQIDARHQEEMLKLQRDKLALISQKARSKGLPKEVLATAVGAILQNPQLAPQIQQGLSRIKQNLEGVK